MKLTILGSGTGVPTLQRSSPAYLLEAPGGCGLIDCGSGTLRQLLHLGRPCSEVDVVFVTHTHPDHIGDLAPLIHALKIPIGYRRESPLHLVGPTGFPDFYQACIATVATPPKAFAVEVAVARERFECLGLTVRTTPVRHVARLNSIAYRFEAAGKAVVFSGDCDDDPRLAALATGADALVIDCSFTDELKKPGHLSASECGRIARDARVGTLILSHLYPVIGSDDTRLDEAIAACDCNVQLAADLMEIQC